MILRTNILIELSSYSKNTHNNNLNFQSKIEDGESEDLKKSIDFLS